MLSDRRKPFPIGKSKGVTLPAAMQISDEGISMAAGDRLILMDTTGEVPEAKLLQFFMQYVDQPFQNWWQAEKQASKRPGGFRVMQAGATGWVIGEERNYIWVTQESGNWFEIPWDDILYHCEPEYEYYKGKRDQDSGGSLKQIGERVRELREAKGLSVNDLAVKEGMKRPVDRQR